MADSADIGPNIMRNPGIGAERKKIGGIHMDKKIRISKKTVILAILVAVLLVVSGVLGWLFGHKLPRDRALEAYAAAVETYDIAVTAYSAAIEEYLDAAAAYNQAAADYNKATNDYNDGVSDIGSVNSALKEAIDEALADLDAGAEPYDITKRIALRGAIENALGAILDVPEAVEPVAAIEESLTAPRPDPVTDNCAELTTRELNAQTAAIQDAVTELAALKTDLEAKTAEIEAKAADILAAADTLKARADKMEAPDYADVRQALDLAREAYDKDIAILRQITNPSEDFIISRITGLKNVGDVAAATGGNDPGGLLHKPGGCTAVIYFSSPLVTDGSLHSGDVIADGVAGGGVIEVFANVGDALERNNGLAALDATDRAGGIHIIVGTFVVRISDQLPPSEQLALADEIIGAIMRVD